MPVNLPLLMPDDQPNAKEVKKSASLPLLLPDGSEYADPMQQVRKNAHSTFGKSPDQSAEDLKIGQQMGYNAGLVSRNRDEIKDIFETQDIATKASTSPGVANYLTSEENMAISRDDIDNLRQVEKTFTDYALEIPKEYLLDPLVSIGKGLGRFPYQFSASFWDITAMAAGAADNATQAIETVTGLKRGGLFRNIRDWSHNEARAIYNYVDANPYIAKSDEFKGPLIENLDYLLDPEYLVDQTMDAAASMAPVLAATYFSGGSALAGGAVGGGMEASSLYREMTEEGKVSDAAALSASIIYGSASAWLNKVGLDSVLGKTPTKNIATRIAKAVASGGVEAFTEWAEEPTQAAIKAIAEEGLDPVVVERTIEAMKNVDVAVGAFFMGGGTSYTHQSVEVAKIKAAERDKAFFESLGNLANESQTRNRLPEAFEKVVDSIQKTTGGAVENVYIDAELFQQALANQPEVMQDILAKTGTAEQFTEALAHGGYLTIPISKYAAYVAGTDTSNALINDLRFRKDGMSFNEAQKARKEWADTMQKQLDELKAGGEAVNTFEQERQAVYDDVLERRQAVGAVPETAQQDAMAWAAYASTFSQRYPQYGTPMQVYERIMPEVRAEKFANMTADQTQTQQWQQTLEQGPVFDSTGAEIDQADFLSAYDTGFPITHSGGDIDTIGTGVFDGIFGSSGTESYGGINNENTQTTFFPRKGKVMREGDVDVDYDRAIDFLRKEFPGATDDVLNQIYEITAGDANVFDSEVNPLESYGFSDLGEASWEAQRLRGQIGLDQGFDAVAMRDETGISYLIPKGSKAAQIKSVNNRGTFDPADPRILNQAGPSMITQHNLSLENLLHADKMGGLAVPSLGVASTEAPLEGFGEISLIADPSLLFSEGSRVFNADVYSPRYPRSAISYKIDQTAMSKARGKLSGAFKALGQSAFSGLSDIENRGMDEFLDEAAVQYAYLKSIGKAPTIKYKKKEKFPAYLTKVEGIRYDLTQNEDFKAAAKKYYEAQVERVMSKLNLAEDKAEATREGLSSEYFDENGEVFYSKLDQLAHRVSVAKGPEEVDYYTAQRDLRKLINKPKTFKAFTEWVAEEFSGVITGEQIFNGFTNSGNRRYLPHDLDTVVKIMKKGLKDGEGFNYGVGSIRATVTRQFKSIKDIQKDRDKLVSSAVMDRVKEEVDQEFTDLSDELKPFYKHDSNSFRYLDEVCDAFKEFGKRGMYGFNEYYENVPNELLEKVRSFLQKLTNLPTEYFEAKVQRAVNLSEFAGAVVPSGKNYDPAIKVLRKNGITDIKRYEKGNSESRTAAISSFNQQLFQTSTPVFKVKPPKKLYRGVSSGGEGLGIYSLGKGLYSTKDKSFAKKFGDKVVDVSVDEYFPRNPLVLRHVAGGASSALLDHAIRRGEVKNAREFSAKYPDPGGYVKAQGFDGVIAGDEIVRYADVLFQTSPGLYSPTMRTIEGMDFRTMPAKDLVNRIKKTQGIKQEELDDLGLIEWLEGIEGKVGKAAALDFIQKGGPQLEEITKADFDDLIRTDEMLRQLTAQEEDAYDEMLRLDSEDADEVDVKKAAARYDELHDLVVERQDQLEDLSSAKYSEYKLPGGDNYREVLVTVPSSAKSDMPEERKARLNNLLRNFGPTDPRYLAELNTQDKEADTVYRSSHWDEPNVLAHFRLQDMTDADGNKTLLIEEIQSDWHQAGRKKGYMPETQKKLDSLNEEIRKIEKKGASATSEEKQRWADLMNERQPLLMSLGVPNAPFKKSWPMLAFKKILQQAVEQGYNSVSWTPGSVQAERYDLSKQVSRVAYNSNTKTLEAYGLQAERLIDKEGVEPDQLSDYIGKEAADKLMKAPTEMGYHTMEGEDLKVGGEGMKGFYDKILPTGVGKYIKKLDKAAKVGATEIDGTEVWNVPITDNMREEVLTKGQPLYQQTPSTPRGSFTTRNGKPLITLFEEANASTFLHESGHAFFTFMGSLATAPDAPDALKADWKTILDHVGNDGSTELTVEQHETLARTLEAYFMEGKAPSMQLRAVFQKFAAWLKALYRSAFNLGVKVNDDIRPVLDRMFATDQEIEEVQAFYSAQGPFFDAAAEIDEEQKKRYDKLREEANLTAHDKRLRKYVKAYVQAMGGKAAIREQAKKTVDSWPLYKATDEAVAAGGFSAATLDALVGVDARKALSDKRPGLVTKSGKANLADLAETNGYTTPEEMISAMTSAESKDAVVEQVVKRELENASRTVEQGLAEGPAADEDYHSDSQLAVLAAEVQILQQSNRGQGARVIEANVVRDVARNVIKSKSLAEAMNHYRYSQAEAKAARMAREAYKAGDLEKAEKYKRRELLNHALVLEAVSLRKEVDKILRNFNRVVTRKNVDAKYLAQAAQFISRFGFTNKRITLPEGTKSLEVFMGSLKDENAPMPGSVPSWADWVLGTEKDGQAWKEAFNLDDIREADRVVNWLIETGVDVKEGRLATYEQSLQDIKNQCLEPARKLKNKGKLPKNHILRRIQDSTRAFFAEHDMLMFILDRMDGFTALTKKGAEAFGANRTLLGHRLAEAQDKRDRMHKELKSQLTDPLAQLVLSSKKFPKVIQSAVPVPELLRRDGRSWDFNKIIAVALNMGNLTNMQRVISGYDIVTEKEVSERAGDLSNLTRKEAREQLDLARIQLGSERLKTLTSILTKEDWYAIQEIWNVINSYWPQLQEEHVKIHHFEREKASANQLTLKMADGETVTLEGGYYPIKYDPTLSKQIAGWDEKDLMLNDSIFGHPNVKNGMLQTRERMVRMPVDLSFNVLFTHMEDTIHYITHAALIRDIDRITQDSEYQRVMEDKLGDEVYKTIRPILRNIARPERSLGLQLDKMLDKMRVLSTSYILGLNASVATKQLFSLPGIWHDIGKRNYARGLLHVMRSPVAAFNAMRDMSVFMETRAKSFDREMRESSTAIFKKGFAGMNPGKRDMLRETAFLPIRLMDFLAVYPSWYGAYLAEMSRTQDPELAVRYADEMIRASQPSSKPMDLSKVQFSRNSITRLFSMFGTFTIKYGNRQRYFYRAWRGGAMSFGDYAWHLALEAIAPPLLMNMMYAALWGEDQDPEDALLDILAYQFTGYALVRDIAGTMVAGVEKSLLGKKTFGRSVGESPVFTGFQVADRAWNALLQIMSDSGDDESVEKAAWAFAELIGFYMGFPASKAASKLMEGIEQFEEDEGTIFNVLVPNPNK